MATESREAVQLVPQDLKLDTRASYLANGLLVGHSLSRSVFGKHLEKKTCGLPRTASSQDQAGGIKVSDNLHLLRREVKGKLLTACRINNELEEWLGNIVELA